MWILGLLAAAALASEPEAGRFDHYQLALSWTPAFCVDAQDRPECVSQSAERFDGRNLALHGLWPGIVGDAYPFRYTYCGVPAEVSRLKHPSQWSGLPEPELSEETRRLMSVCMPGASSLLHRHQWAKHGTCSGLSPDEYFSASCGLVAAVSRSRVGRFLSQSVGYAVETAALLSLVEQDFGRGGRDAARLVCSKIGGVAVLSEIRLYFKPRLEAGAALTGQFTPAEASPYGACPERVVLVAPHPSLIY